MNNTNSEDKRKHLEMIQAIINRMASNSFVFKGWSITIIAGLTGLAAKDTNGYLIYISIIATLMFWAVDAYYLMLEREFRDLYKQIAKKDSSKIDFMMKIPGSNFQNWLTTIRRPILSIFYGIVLIMLIVAALIIGEF